jgi:gentisate 1,2-dioxygenase
MHANNMYGLWELASQMTPQPQPKMIAHMWPWSTLDSIVTESTQAVRWVTSGGHCNYLIRAWRPLGDDE